MLSPSLGQLWPRRGQRHGILGWGGLDPPEEGRALGPCRASAAPEMLGETKPPCPGRAFSPWGCPGVGAPRKVSLPEEPQPHQSAGCSALGQARPLKNCRLWATVRVKRATDPLATAPPWVVPAPTVWGPSFGGPLQVCRPLQSTAHGSCPGVGAGRSRRKALPGLCPPPACWSTPLLAGPRRKATTALPEPRAGFQFHSCGRASLPPPRTPHLRPSWLPLCLSGPRASGASGG